MGHGRSAATRDRGVGGGGWQGRRHAGAQGVQTKEGADVTFKVDGEVLAAQAILLAMRSSVFRAELYGPMKKEHGEHKHISIKDMEPDVFRALLHSIYTDAMFPGLDDLDRVGRKEFIKHLFARGGGSDSSSSVRGLCESLTIATVADMFVLADRHSCSKLRDACVEFITCLDALADVVVSKGYRHLK
ncbi:hypothetical protein U9M48_040338, partial [Paspalum notatum var. saurae]